MTEAAQKLIHCTSGWSTNFLQGCHGTQRKTRQHQCGAAQSEPPFLECPIEQQTAGWYEGMEVSVCHLADSVRFGWLSTQSVSHHMPAVAPGPGPSSVVTNSQKSSTKGT